MSGPLPRIGLHLTALGDRGETGQVVVPSDGVNHYLISREVTVDVVFDIEVIAASDGVVEWHVPESPPWWKGTTIRFEAGPDENGKTAFLFTRGFAEDDPIIAAITPARVRFLDRSVEVAESVRPNPVVVN